MKKLYPPTGNLLFPVIFFFQIILISSFLFPNATYAQCSPPVLVVKQPAPICSPGTVDITAPGILDLTQSNIPAGTVFTYFLNNTQVNNPSAVSASGIYTIEAGVSTPDGSFCSAFANVTVLVNKTPVITPLNPNSFCSDDANQYALTSSIGSIWNGDGVIGGFNFQPSSAGPGVHTLSTTAIGGCTASQQVTVFQTPVLVVKQPAPVCSPATIDLTKVLDMTRSIIPAGTVFTYFLNNTQVNNPSAVSASGTYSIEAAIANPDASFCSAFANVTVLVNKTPVITPLNPNSFCSDDANQYALTSSIGSIWNGDGVIGGFNFQPSSAGPGVHTLSTTAIGGCTASQQVTVFQTPVLVLKPSSPVCSPATVDMTKLIDYTNSVLPAGTTISYIDPTGNNLVSNPSAVSQSGVYSIEAFGPSQTANGCFDRKFVTITVNQSPVITLINPGPYCSNDQSNLALNATPTGLIIWNGDGVVSNGGAYSFNPASAGPGTHTLTATNILGGCQATEQFVVAQTPVLVLKPSTPVCSPATVDLTKLIDYTNSVLPAGTTISYIDPTGNNLVSNPSAVSQSGVYSIEAFGPSQTANGCFDRKFVTITVNQSPVITLINPGPYCSNDQSNLALNATPTGLIIWNGDGVVSNGGAYSFNPASAGPGTHTLTATNILGGCQATEQFVVAQTPVLFVNPTAPVCSPQTVDLTKLIDLSKSIIPAGSIILYQTDLSGTQVTNPKAISQSGVYYLVVVPPYGNGGLCNNGTAVNVIINQTPVITPLNPNTFCSNDQNNYTLQSVPSAFWTGDGVISATSFQPFAAGVGIHILTATDKINGCQATQQVTVLAPPIISSCPPDITVSNDPGKCGAVVTYSPPTLTGGCGNPTLTSSGPASGSLFPTGVTTVTYTIKDASGTIISSCSFKVTVTDTEKPVITCNADQVLTSDAGKCGTTYSSIPTATDNCPGVKVTGSRSDGKSTSDPYPVGVTTITWTATDAAGNTSTCTQKITVTDKEVPVITCAANVIASNDPGLCQATISVVSPTATDNCSVVSIVGVRSDGKLISDPYPVGSTLIIWTATDANGNKSSCNQSILVADKELPKITAPANITTTASTGNCYVSGIALGTPATSDNCGIASVTNNAPAKFNVGTTTVTWTVTDVNGNVNSATQTVTVTDNQKPAITGILSKTFCGGGLSYTVNPVTVSDNCGVPTVTFNITGATTRTGTGVDASGAFNVGTSTIVWTATDGSGNTNTWTTTVKVGNPITLNIPDAYSMSMGVAANTVYIGYSPASSITLKPVATGGTGLITYLWSTGATTVNITVSPTVTTTYTLTVKDAAGCTSTMTKTINVVDIRCGNNKVTLCCKSSTGTQTLCINTSQVAGYLLFGAKLGSCSSNVMTTVTKGRDVMEQPLETLSMMAYPNPSPGGFTIEAKGLNAKQTAKLVVYNVSGKIIDFKNVVQGQLIKLGAAYRSGIYFAELIQGDKRTTIKLVKRSD